MSKCRKCCQGEREGHPSKVKAMEGRVEIPHQAQILWSLPIFCPASAECAEIFRRGIEHSGPFWKAVPD